MIPILYEATEQAFTSNGLGRLRDCKQCTVREVRNGEYVLTMQYPVTGSLYSEIRLGRMIGAIHDDNKDVQPFILYAHTKPLNGLVTFYAYHLSYRLKDVVIKPFTASTCAAAIAAMKTQAYGENRFTFWTDKSVTANYKNQIPSSCRSLLAGEENSMLDVYGEGEYEFDKWAVKLHLHRGSNKGVSIRYGVNMTGFEQGVDYQEVYNAVAPYWTDGETGVATTLPEGFIIVGTPQTTLMPWTDNNGNYMTDNNGNLFEFKVPDLRVHPLDLTEQFEERPTADQLRAAAVSAASSSSPWLPTENIKLSYVNQGNDFEPLQTVRLCDEINVYCGPLGVSAASMEVVSVDYDVLNERNTAIEVGVLKSHFADTIRKATLSSAMSYANAIAAAKTNRLDLSLTQQEIFDRLTDGGLEQGLALESTFNEAPSAAGDKKLYLNLDYARFGKLVADFIQGGTLTLGGYDNVNGELQIVNADNNVIGKWGRDGIVVNAGSIIANAIQGGTLTLGGTNNTNGQMAILDSSGQQIGTWDNTKLKLGVDWNYVQLFGLAEYNGVTAVTPFYAVQTYNGGAPFEMMLKDGMLVLIRGSSGAQLDADAIRLTADNGEGYESTLEIAENYIAALRGGTFTLEVDNGTLDFLVDGLSINGTAGASGTFTTANGKTVTVTNGIITRIA